MNSNERGGKGKKKRNVEFGMRKKNEESAFFYDPRSTIYDLRSAIFLVAW
jgi:hypothetical protein